MRRTQACGLADLYFLRSLLDRASTAVSRTCQTTSTAAADWFNEQSPAPFGLLFRARGAFHKRGDIGRPYKQAQVGAHGLIGSFGPHSMLLRHIKPRTEVSKGSGTMTSLSTPPLHFSESTLEKLRFQDVAYCFSCRGQGICNALDFLATGLRHFFLAAT